MSTDDVMREFNNKCEDRQPETDLAVFISELTVDDIPNQGLQTARRCFIDTLGVTLAGAQTSAGIKSANAVCEMDIGSSGSPMLANGGVASENNAVFANSTAAHALDFDDDQFQITSHPSSTMIPPILTIASTDRMSGNDALAAYVAGFETQYYLSQWITPSHYEAGWHGTATFGTFGATAAVAHALGLSEKEISHALNIAASMPAGIYGNFGSMTKPMHAGQAAQSGVKAARLAQKGFTASSSAISGNKGFFELYSGDAGVDSDTLPSLGDYWAIVKNGVYTKKYPCCYATHNAIEATRQLIDENDIDPKSITAVEVIASKGADAMLTYSNPQTSFEAKFSMEYIIGTMISQGQVNLYSFSPNAVRNSSAESIRERITLSIDPAIDYTDTRATIRIECGDRSYKKSHHNTPGGPANPLTSVELKEKFNHCLLYAGIQDKTNREGLYDTLYSLKDLDNISTIAEKCCTALGHNNP